MNKVIEPLFSKRVSPRIYVFIFDTLLVLLSSFVAYYFHYGFAAFANDIEIDTVISVILLVFINWISFLLFKTYWGVLRFSVFSDIMRILLALSVSYISAFSLLLLFDATNIVTEFPITVFWGSYVLNVMLMSLSRVFVKEFHDKLSSKNNLTVPIMIYGTKEGGTILAKALKGNRDSSFELKGFITDDESMVGKKLMGVNVYSNEESIFDIIMDQGIQKVIVSVHKMESRESLALVEALVDHNISLLVASPLSEWDGKSPIGPQLKEVQIEDLLPRSPINVNLREIAKNLEGRRVLITGAAGSIGSEIVRQVATFNPFKIILLDQAETPLHDMFLEFQREWVNLETEIIVADISNWKRMKKVFEDFKPHYIFHAAAYKHVPMMESNVSESIQNNVLGTKIIADLAVEYKVKKFVMVSTDKAVNPSNVMGCSKRISEIYVQSYAKFLERNGANTTQFITTRFGNVLGSNGSVIPLFKEQIKNGGPVTVTHPEIIRYFMTIPEACQLVLEAGSMGKGGEIYLFDMGKPVKIVDLAKRMILLSGAKNVEIEYTGLRHGEKLYEELLNNDENTTKTHHDKIMIAHVMDYDYEKANKSIDELIDISFEFDDMLTVKKMKEIVPEFQSMNSKFESLDV